MVGTRRTLAVEAEDPAAVRAGVIALGLAERVNTSVPRGLAILVDDEPPRYAVIDVGTNSVKFHVGEQASDGTWRAVVDRAEITRLGDGLAETGAISTRRADANHDARSRAWSTRPGSTTSGRSSRSARPGCAWPAIGTTSWPRSQARRASPSSRSPAKRRAAWPTSPSEPDSASTDGALVVFDTGGGSTQFTFGHGAEVDERFSVDVGAVRYTERFGLAARRVD